MPNHITNRLTILGDEEQVNKVLDFIKVEEGSDADDGENGIGTIDFNKIIPMPDHIYKGDLSFEKQKESNGNNWYDWSIENWGTKWNAYSYMLNEDDNTLFFNTAWSGVPDLMEKLSSIFPDIKFEYAFADEDFGYNVASLELINGVMTNVCTPEDGSKEAYDLAFDVLGTTPEEMGMIYDKDKQNYIYSDEY